MMRRRVTHLRVIQGGRADENTARRHLYAYERRTVRAEPKRAEHPRPVPPAPTLPPAA